MNYKLIHNLAIKYKKARNRVSKNKLFVDLQQEYLPILRSFATKYTHSVDEYNEFAQTFYCQILYALTEYNVKSEAKFNTFSYYYILATPRLYFKDRQPMRCSRTDDIEDNEIEQDFMLDLEKILDPDELLIFKLYISKFMSESRITNNIRDKITSYTRGQLGRE